MINTETESKFTLDASGYSAIRAAGHALRRIEQLNVYYDDAWKLADHGATFRIRCEPSKPSVVTLKTVLDWSGVIRSASEIEVDLAALQCRSSTTLPRQFLVASVLPLQFSLALNKLTVNTLTRVGWMRNQRDVVVVGPMLIELDRFKLPDGSTGYEAELESDDPTRHTAFANMVKCLAPGAQPSKVSKFERFRQAVNKQHAASV